MQAGHPQISDPVPVFFDPGSPSSRSVERAPRPAAKAIASADGDTSSGAKFLEVLEPATLSWALVQT